MAKAKKTGSSPKKKKASPPLQKPPREDKLFLNLSRLAKQYMSGKGYKPLNEAQLMERLGLPPQHNLIFNEVINELQSQGLIEIVRGTFIWKQSQANVVSGVLRVHPRGFGFLRVDDPALFAEDIFIPKHLTMKAVDGDTVEVLINSEVISEKGPEGKVVAILKRSRSHMAGIIQTVNSLGEATAYVPLLGTQARVVIQPHPEHNFTVGDRVVMEVTDWGSSQERDADTHCRMSHYIGHISDPSCDVKAAIEEFEIRTDYPQKILEEVSHFKKASVKDIASRRDLRDLECFTIDPDTAKDFDDALSLSKDKKGHYHLGVHIADVSHYVKPGTAIDKEAILRCNSTYFPGECVPMLPEELSNHLCSLKEGVIRLTASVLMEFDPEGTLVNFEFAKAAIKSVKRFSYKEAKLVLDGKKKSAQAPTLKLMVELCGHLKKKRYERGSLEFAIPELVILVDEKGVPTKTDNIQYDITHQLVEEFMLKANEVVATHLCNLGKNLAYRIHEEPAEENMKDFSLLALAFGFNLPERPTPQELQKMFDEALKTSYGQYLATSYIRRMRLAIYSPANIGHYGLGLTHYCHFTSPIRRYIDLVIHRILFGEKDDLKDLEAISLACSEQERVSAKAEQNVVLLKKLRLLERHQSEDKFRQYEAVVTRVKPFGIFFEVLDYMLESFLHVSELHNDYFNYIEEKAQLVGERSNQSYHSGDKILISLKEVDFIKLESHWSLVWKEKSSEKPTRKSKKLGLRGKKEVSKKRRRK